MRRLLIVTIILMTSAVARADDDTASVHATANDRGDTAYVGAAAAGGAQGDASYAAVDVRADAVWDGVQLGLGWRGVWIGGAFRRSDWDRPADIVNALRYLEAATRFDGDGRIAIAAGGLAPAHVAQLVDGYRVQLDDLLHTGARLAVSEGRLELGAEIDDVLDPAVIAGSARWGIGGGWGLGLAAAIDPMAPDGEDGDTTRAASAIEASVTRRIIGREARAELGAGVVGEPGLGVSGVGFASGELDAAGIKLTAAGDVRGGTGTVGAAFGPLYRVERRTLDARAEMGELDGVGAGLALGAALPAGWLQLGMRARPGLASLATVYGGTPIGQRVQAGVWLAASRDDAAGTAELRVTWNRYLYSALDAARLYQFTPMDATAVWSVVGWLGVTSD